MFRANYMLCGSDLIEAKVLLLTRRQDLIVELP